MPSNAAQPPPDRGGDCRGRLRQLGSHDERATWAWLGAPPPGGRHTGLDGKADALVRLAALIAMCAPASCYRSPVDAALSSGADVDDVLGTLVAIAPIVGLSRLVPASVALALALGYDVEAAIESRDPPVTPDANDGRDGQAPPRAPSPLSREAEKWLRRLALNDEDAVASALCMAHGGSVAAAPDVRMCALATIAALIGTEPALASYQWAVERALAVGAQPDDIVDVLTGVGPIIGLVRTTSAAAALAVALGYDIHSSPMQ